MSLQRRLARFNRVFGNRIAGPGIARLPGFGSLHHRGRSSGRAYRTPVKVFHRDADYVVSLPYGQESDWVKNVLAAGHCDLVTRGRRIRLADPRVYEDLRPDYVPAPIRAVLKRVGATEFIALRAVETAERPPVSPASRRDPGEPST